MTRLFWKWKKKFLLAYGADVWWAINFILVAKESFQWKRTKPFSPLPPEVMKRAVNSVYYNRRRAAHPFGRARHLSTTTTDLGKRHSLPLPRPPSLPRAIRRTIKRRYVLRLLNLTSLSQCSAAEENLLHIRRTIERVPTTDGMQVKNSATPPLLFRFFCT